MKEITKVKSGEKVGIIHYDPNAGKRYPLNNKKIPRTIIRKEFVTAKPPCEDRRNGNWFCVTHNLTFGNQIEKDNHIQGGTHLLAWKCNEHGLEQP